ncbi:MAG: sugar phosphate isomerase/epimerase family protein [Opitutaceae bacterium]
MKFGAHSYLFTPRWDDSQLGILDHAKDLDLDFFEIGIGDDVVFSHRKTRLAAEKLGLELVVSPGGLWPVHCDLSLDDKASRQAGLAWHCKAIDRAARVGATAYAGALYGHPGTVLKRRPPLGQYQRTAEELHQLAEYGRKKDVAVVIEPMSHFRTHMVNTPEQVMRLVRLADHPNLRVSLDTYHLITEITDFHEAILTVRDALWGMHMCENNRGVPGPGLVPWSSVFKGLREISFDGYILFEAYNSSIGDFAFERAMFHNVCPDPAVFVQDGMRFIRKGLRGQEA